jgi:hypothetical protein
LGKAKITDRINRIDKIYIKNPDNPVNPVENRHEKFFVSGTEMLCRTFFERMGLDNQSVNQCLINKCPEIVRYRISAARHVLHHEDTNELLLWINPEMCIGPTAPTMKAHRSHHA